MFVLGAGASAPYGFPVGRGLLMEICKLIGMTESEGGALGHQLLAFRFDSKKVYSFANDLYRSQQPSVDAFLENRPEYMEIGKTAIAAALIPYEIEGTLYRNDWYEYLVRMIAPTQNAFLKSSLSIITFNYDRSLEHSLFVALKASFGLSDADSAKLLSSLPIVHVHGLLGGLPYLTESEARPYVPKLTPELVKVAAAQILIVHEVDGLGPAFERAHELLSKAAKVCFLGFGYLPANVVRLQINQLCREGVLIGTAFDMQDAERNRAVGLFKNGLSLSNENVLSFLRSRLMFD